MKVAQIYGTAEIEEMYNCGFGFNRSYAQLFENSAMRISGLDQDGEIRVFELFDHPFFVATQYQPERRALEGKRHPLITAFVNAVGQVAVGQPHVIGVTRAGLEAARRQGRVGGESVSS